MKTVKFWTVIIIATTLFVFSAIMFCWTLWGQFNTDLAIDSGRFSDFGSFIGGIFGTLSFILLILTLKETREQSFDNSFFNHLQLHDSVVQQLKSKEKEIATLNSEYKKLFENSYCDTITDNVLKEECKSYSAFTHDGYFEALYAILHVRYKYRNTNPWDFFKDNNWRVGHFLNSFTSVIELIVEADLTDKKRHFYSRVIKSRSTSDEIRLVFYYVTFNGDHKERIRLVKLFRSLNFFDNMRDGLIKDGDKKVFTDIKLS